MYCLPYVSIRLRSAGMLSRVFICFNDDVSSSGYTESNEWMIVKNDLKMIQKETIVA
jgi:hypothetical protein